MSIQLSKLLSVLPSYLLPSRKSIGNSVGDLQLEDMTHDLSRVGPGCLFIPLEDSGYDVMDSVTKAVELGASVILFDDCDLEFSNDYPVMFVTDRREAVSLLSPCFFGYPAKDLRLIGITGTNGKTSTSYIVQSIFLEAKYGIGVIGTTGAQFLDRTIPTLNTTPEPPELHCLFRAMCNESIDTVIVEASSEGIEVGRLNGCRFTVCAFTNLSRDHLDFHGSMDQYFHSKSRLFDEFISPGGTAVINVDDPVSGKLCSIAKCKGAQIIRCSHTANKKADVSIGEFEVGPHGGKATVSLPSTSIDVNLNLLGDFQIENLSVACGIALAFDIDARFVASGVATCRQIPGRMEIIDAGFLGQPFVIVDYAHTPDALLKVLRTLRSFVSGRIFTVFGCGGDRDSSKRPIMAQIAEEYSDKIILTSDNPRSEDPKSIFRDMIRGFQYITQEEPFKDEPRNSYSVILDRREAIKTALAIAESTDTVLIAGKGHENYQIIGYEKTLFNDSLEAQKSLEEIFLRETDKRSGV